MDDPQERLFGDDDPSPTPVDRRATSMRLGSGQPALLPLIASLVLLGIAVALLSPGLGSAGPPATATATPVSVAISRDRAVEIARARVQPEAKLRTVQHGRFADVYTRIGPANIAQAGDEVWAIQFDLQFVICPPNGDPCWSPQPGITTVIIDYYTGDWITNYADSQAQRKRTQPAQPISVRGSRLRLLSTWAPSFHETEAPALGGDRRLGGTTVELSARSEQRRPGR